MIKVFYEWENEGSEGTKREWMKEGVNNRSPVKKLAWELNTNEAYKNIIIIAEC